MVKGKKLESKKKDSDKVYKELEVLKLMLARALADYDNLNKRVERERGTLAKIASLGILTRLLPVLDNLESAQDHLQDAGLAICIGEFKKILNEDGLVEVKPKVGEEFDQETMEAIEVVAGKRDNIISEVTLTGWKFEDGQIVRHAKVKVSKADIDN
jgi:molecular chaperone GrpE